MVTHNQLFIMLLLFIHLIYLIIVIVILIVSHLMCHVLWLIVTIVVMLTRITTIWLLWMWRITIVHWSILHTRLLLLLLLNLILIAIALRVQSSSIHLCNRTPKQLNVTIENLFLVSLECFLQHRNIYKLHIGITS
ncbi:hypothetical protein D3C80_1545750 [compost metagenome]